MQPTIRDVAREAKTSVSTVSRILTGRGPVAEKTRRRVLEAIERLGYKPNALARGLVQKRTGTIGVVLPDVANPFYADMLRGMGDVAAERDFHLLLVNADLSFEKEKDGLAVLQEKQVDGVIYASGMITPDHEALFRQLHRPVALAATSDPEGEFPAVLVDSYQGARLAVEHLAELGHRRIAVINGPLRDTVAGLVRWQGYQDAAAARGIPLDPALTAEADFRFETAYKAMEAVLERGQPFTAVVAASDIMAIGAMNALLDRGYRVPEQVSVVGFDNIWLSAMVRPSLTTIAQPMYEIGARAVTMLIRAMEGEQEPVTDWIEPHLVVRQSTAEAAS